MARLTAKAKVRRDFEIVADRARGISWPTIAATYELSETQVRNIYRAARASDVAEADEPRAIETIDEVLLQYESVIEDCATLYASSNNDSVRLGAVKARQAAIGSKLETLQALGILPRLSTVHFAADAQKVVDSVSAVMEKHGAGEQVENELVTALEAALPSPYAYARRKMFGQPSPEVTAQPGRRGGR
jgi:hypothetical protein